MSVLSLVDVITRNDVRITRVFTETYRTQDGHLNNLGLFCRFDF
jgi:hypothetical protein